MSDNHINKAVGAVKWSYLTEILSMVYSPLFTLILTKLLLPEDFGIFGASAAAMMFINNLHDFGFNQALIQRQEKIDKALNSSFWALWIYSIILFIIIYFLAPTLGNFYHSPKSILIIRVLSLNILLPSLIPSIILVRKFLFKTLLIINIISTLLSSIAILTLAYLHFGYYALLIGSLINTIINFVLLWSITKWRPKLQFDFTIIKELFSYGKWIFAENFLMIFYIYGGIILVTHYFGLSNSGIYQVGMSTATIFFSIIIYPITQVLFPLLSKIQKNKKTFNNILMKITRVSSVLAIPAGLCILFFGSAFSNLLWANKWQGVGFVISIMGIKNALGSILIAMPEGIKAIGKPIVNIKSGFYDLLLFLGVFIFLPQFGLKIFTLGILFATLGGILIFIYFTKKYLDFGLLKLYRLIFPAILGGVIILPFLYIFAFLAGDFIGIKGWFKLSFEILIIVLLYIFSLKKISPKIFTEFLELTYKVFPFGSLNPINILQRLHYKKWEKAQFYEKEFWLDWFKKNENDSLWLNYVLKNFGLDKKTKLNNQVLIDIGSGPFGVLTVLKSKKKIAIDPLLFPNKNKSILHLKSSGEDAQIPEEYADKIFIYNTLQHVISPNKILNNSIKWLKTNGNLYILEQLNVPKDNLHIHKLSKILFDKFISKYHLKVIKYKIIKNSDFSQKYIQSKKSIICLILSR